MKRVILFLIIFILSYTQVLSIDFPPRVNPSVASNVLSSDYILPYAGILPDHPLYFLKVGRDRILDFFTKEGVKRVEFNLLMADKRLKMGEQLMDNGKNALALTTVSKGEKYFAKSVSSLVVVRGSSKENASMLYEKLAKSSVKHKEVIEKLMEKDPLQKEEWKKVLGILSQAQIELVSMK